jgi:hypothetical protein
MTEQQHEGLFNEMIAFAVLSAQMIDGDDMLKISDYVPYPVQ